MYKIHLNNFLTTLSQLNVPIMVQLVSKIMWPFVYIHNVLSFFPVNPYINSVSPMEIYMQLL